jgi:hypothetical protein
MRGVIASLSRLIEDHYELAVAAAFTVLGGAVAAVALLLTQPGAPLGGPVHDAIRGAPPASLAGGSHPAVSMPSRPAGSPLPSQSSQPGSRSGQSPGSRPTGKPMPSQPPDPTPTSRPSRSPSPSPSPKPKPSPPCSPGTTANLRWHYSANGSAGGWSGTTAASCHGSLAMGPQAMEGDLKTTPGAAIQAGYDLTVPGSHTTLTLTVGKPQVTFTVRCVSGATPSVPTFTVTMPAASYTITADAWYPSGDQSSPLVYQGSYTVPDLCAGGLIRLGKGGTFTATLG